MDPMNAESAGSGGSRDASPQRRGACIPRPEQGGMRGARPPQMAKKALLVLALSLAVACAVRQVQDETIPDPSKVDLASEESTAGVGSRTQGCVKCHVGQ